MCNRMQGGISFKKLSWCDAKDYACQGYSVYLGSEL